MNTLLAKDRFFLLTFFFWMFAGCALIIPLVFVVIAGTNLFSARFAESPEPFNSEALFPFLKWLAWLAVVLVLSLAAFLAGLRDRIVILNNEKVEIHWGMRLPLVLRRMNATSLSNFRVTREKRFALNAHGGGRYGYRQMPDRWRLTADINGRRINLGSYTTEQDANNVVKMIHSHS